jgi:hypothetical protein
MRLSMLCVHFAVRWMRQDKAKGQGNVIAWAPFMHLGC